MCKGTKPVSKAEESLAYLRNLPDGTSNGRIFGSVHGVRLNEKTGLFEGTYLNGTRLTLTGNGINETIFSSGTYEHLGFGDFSIDNLKPGKYKLQVFLPSYYGFRYDDGFVREINLNGRGCSREFFFADVENSIEGRVTDQNGNPLKQVTVELMPATKREDDNDDDNYSMWTDDNGRFVFKYVFPRDYYLGINISEKEEYECDEDEDCSGDTPEPKLYYPNAAEPSEARRISFSLGQKLTGYNLVLERNGSDK